MLLSLQSISLDTPFKQTGECLMFTELILPRPGIAKKSALKDLRLTKGKRSLARAPFYEKALLKEKVDGLFGIRVSVTRPLKHPELNQFMQQLLATGIQGGADLLSALIIRYSPLDDVLEEAGDLLADKVASTSSMFIASGGIDLDSESLTPGPVTIPLNLNATHRLSDVPVGPKAREKRKTSAKLYKKGSAVGSLVLDVGV